MGAGGYDEGLVFGGESSGEDVACVPFANRRVF